MLGLPVVVETVAFNRFGVSVFPSMLVIVSGVGDKIGSFWWVLVFVGVATAVLWVVFIVDKFAFSGAVVIGVVVSGVWDMLVAMF